jgi:RNA polymerase sigma-70 factor (ECF subfamily)
MRDGEPTSQIPLRSDDAKFAEIYSRYGRQVQAYCARRIDRSHVADAVAETFLVAWRRLDQIDDVDAALMWLYGTAYRVVGHQLRSRSRARSLVQRLRGVAVAEAETSDSIAVRREQTDLVMLAASRLKEIDREVLRLELWEGLTHSEVAVALAIKPESARQRASRARRNLAKEYAKLTGERRPLVLEGGGGL